MSYTPTNWKAGDTVTSAKLNKMEQGIAGAMSASSSANILIATATENENVLTLDKTWAEVNSADLAFVKQQMQTGTYCLWTVIETDVDNGAYIVVIKGEDTKELSCNSEDGYPSISYDGLPTGNDHPVS